MREWIAFWNAPHSVYVNDRHCDVHYRVIADDLAAHVPHAQARILDYGCGEALHAERLAERAGALTLCDAAPTVQERLARRLAGASKVRVATPDQVASMPDASFDLIVLHSVAQYLTAEELDALLLLFRRLLRAQGRLVVGDILPETASALRDTASLLRFAAANGFLFAAVGGLVRTALSDYRKLRMRLGLSVYSEAQMLARLAGAGFAAERAARNLGHNQGRMTFVARPAPPLAKSDEDRQTPAAAVMREGG
jgi:SAM-dependent methyltransferase